MSFLRRISAISLAAAIVWAVPASPLHAQITPRPGGPNVTPRLQFPVVEPKSAESKATGRWTFKDAANDMAVELGADGLGKFEYQAEGKTHSLSAKLKDGELRVDYGKGFFLIYNAAVLDGKLVLSGGPMAENQKLQLTRANVNSTVNPAPKQVVEADRGPKLYVEPKASPNDAKGEKGYHDSPRGPRPEPTPPKKGEEPSEEFLLKLIQHTAEGNSGGITYLMDIHSYTVGPARAASPTETQPYATGSKVTPVLVKWTYKAYGQSSTATRERETQYICWMTDTGAWRAGSIDDKSLSELKSVDK